MYITHTRPLGIPLKRGKTPLSKAIIVLLKSTSKEILILLVIQSNVNLGSTINTNQLIEKHGVSIKRLMLWTLTQSMQRIIG